MISQFKIYSPSKGGKSSADLKDLLSGLRKDLLHLLFMRLLQGGDGGLVFVIFCVQCIDNL